LSERLIVWRFGSVRSEVRRCESAAGISDRRRAVKISARLATCMGLLKRRSPRLKLSGAYVYKTSNLKAAPPTRTMIAG
jgi:hypothetical protein